MEAINTAGWVLVHNNNNIIIILSDESFLQYKNSTKNSTKQKKTHVIWCTNLVPYILTAYLLRIFPRAFHKRWEQRYRSEDQKIKRMMTVSLQEALEPCYIHYVGGKGWRRQWRRFETATSLPLNQHWVIGNRKAIEIVWSYRVIDN